MRPSISNELTDLEGKEDKNARSKPIGCLFFTPKETGTYARKILFSLKQKKTGAGFLPAPV